MAVAHNIEIFIRLLKRRYIGQPLSGTRRFIEISIVIEFVKQPATVVCGRILRVFVVRENNKFDLSGCGGSQDSES